MTPTSSSTAEESPDESPEDDPLEGLVDVDVGALEGVVDEAEAQRAEAIESIKTLRQVEEELHQVADDLYERGLMGEEDRKTVAAAIEDGDYGGARQVIEACAPDLGFEDGEKAALVAAIGKEFQELRSHLELVRNALMSIREKGWSDEDLVAYIYGSHPSLTKKSIRTALDAIGESTDQDVDVDELAAYIAHNTHHDVTVGDARTVVQALNEANRREGAP